MKKSSVKSSKALVDTNILVYAYDMESPFHSKARSWLEDQENIVISSQNLLEFYSIITSAKRVHTPIPTIDALQAVEEICAASEIIYPSNKTTELFIELLKQTKRSGVFIFDLYLASIMLSNNISKLYTANVDDFEGIQDLEVSNPLL